MSPNSGTMFGFLVTAGLLLFVAMAVRLLDSEFDDVDLEVTNQVTDASGPNKSRVHRDFGSSIDRAPIGGRESPVASPSVVSFGLETKSGAAIPLGLEVRCRVELRGKSKLQSLFSDGTIDQRFHFPAGNGELNIQIEVDGFQSINREARVEESRGLDLGQIVLVGELPLLVRIVSSCALGDISVVAFRRADPPFVVDRTLIEVRTAGEHDAELRIMRDGAWTVAVSHRSAGVIESISIPHEPNEGMPIVFDLRDYMRHRFKVLGFPEWFLADYVEIVVPIDQRESRNLIPLDSMQRFAFVAKDIGKAEFYLPLVFDRIALQPRAALGTDSSLVAAEPYSVIRVESWNKEKPNLDGLSLVVNEGVAASLGPLRASRRFLMPSRHPNGEDWKIEIESRDTYGFVLHKGQLPPEVLIETMPVGSSLRVVTVNSGLDPVERKLSIQLLKFQKNGAKCARTGPLAAEVEFEGLRSGDYELRLVNKDDAVEYVRRFHLNNGQAKSIFVESLQRHEKRKVSIRNWRSIPSDLRPQFVEFWTHSEKIDEDGRFELPPLVNTTIVVKFRQLGQRMVHLLGLIERTQDEGWNVEFPLGSICTIAIDVTPRMGENLYVELQAVQDAKAEMVRLITNDRAPAVLYAPKEVELSGTIWEIKGRRKVFRDWIERKHGHIETGGTGRWHKVVNRTGRAVGVHLIRNGRELLASRVEAGTERNVWVPETADDTVFKSQNRIFDVELTDRVVIED